MSGLWAFAGSDPEALARRRRSDAEAKVAELSRKRDAFVAEKRAASGVRDSFDGAVYEAIAAEGKTKGISYLAR